MRRCRPTYRHGTLPHRTGGSRSYLPIRTVLAAGPRTRYHRRMDGWRPAKRSSDDQVEVLTPLLVISFTSDRVISVTRLSGFEGADWSDRLPPDADERLLWEQYLACAWLVWAATMIGQGSAFDQLERELRRCATQGLDVVLRDALGLRVITEVSPISAKRSIQAGISHDEISHVLFWIERFRGLFGVRKLAGHYIPLSTIVFLQRMSSHWSSAEGRVYLETLCRVVADLMRDRPDEFPKYELSPFYFINAKPTHERVMDALAAEPLSNDASEAAE